MRNADTFKAVRENSPRSKLYKHGWAWELVDTPAINEYHGCGHGWIEIDDAGEVTRMRYAANVNSTGTKEQNIDMTDIDPDSLKITPDGYRVPVNFSQASACQF